MASLPPAPQPPTSRTVAALTPEAKLWPAQSPLLERLMQLLYGNEGLDYMAKKQLAEGPRESQPFSMSAELPGANPEAPTPGDAMVGLAMSGGGVPGGISRASAPQIEQRAMSERRPPRRLPGEFSLDDFNSIVRTGLRGSKAAHDSALRRLPKPTSDPGLPTPGGGGIASPDLIAALMEATKATPEVAAPTRRPNLVNNASAESGSGASAEALSRTSGMATRGQKFMIRDRAGNFRPATEDGAMSLRPGESFGIMGPFGFDVHDSK